MTPIQYFSRQAWRARAAAHQASLANEKLIREKNAALRRIDHQSMTIDLLDSSLADLDKQRKQQLDELMRQANCRIEAVGKLAVKWRRIALILIALSLADGLARIFL